VPVAATLAVKLEIIERNHHLMLETPRDLSGLDTKIRLMHLTDTSA